MSGAILGTFSSLQDAEASAFFVKEQSPTAQGNAFAGAVSGAEDPSYLFFNPAAVAWQHGTQIEAGVSYIIPKDEFKNGRGTILNKAIKRDGDGVDGGDPAVVPSFYLTQQLGEEFAVGLGVTAPFGLVTEYDSNWVGRYHAIKSDLKTYNFNPVLTWKPDPGVAVGVGLQVSYIDVELTQATPASPLESGIPGDPADDGFVRATGDDWSYGFTIGAIVEPFDGTRIGASYRSQIAHTIEGDADFIKTALPNGRTGVQASTKLPGIAAVGVTQRLSPSWDVMAEVAMTEWRKFKKLVFKFDKPTLPDSVTDEDWHDAYMIALGTTYRPSDEWTLRMGIAYDESPVPSERRTPRIPDADRYWLSLGASYDLDSWLSLTGAYTFVYMPDTRLRLDGTGNDASRGSLYGNYESNVNIINISAQLRF